MTSGSSKTLDSGQEQFDIAPLSWVMTELREALSSAGKLLNDAIGQEAETQATSLLQAKTYLHQAHGALQIVEVEGVSIVTETVEELIERIQAGKLVISTDVVQRITEAFYAVLRYLEDLLAGNSQQPVRLFPEYRALLELKGAERIHPADLFFPSLSVQEKIPELALSAHPTNINYGAIRLRFEKLLLTVLTSKNADAKLDASNQMSVLIREIEQAQTSSQTKAFWLVMRAFAESTASIDARDERHIKQIWGRINLQIRRLVEGNTSVPERLLRDALFFIAQVREPSAFVAQIRRAYQLDDHVPDDYDQKRYGLIAPNVLANAKELLTNIKNLWGRISNGDNSLVDKFTQKMKDLADLGVSLQSAPLTKLLRELNGIASHAVRAKDKERMGLELATCLLFLENALEQITHLPANFSARADEISARLLSVVSGEVPDGHVTWIGEISREAQQRQTMGVLVGEMQLSLKQAEKALDEHFRDISNTATLAPVDGILAQLGGALAMLDQDDALAAVSHTRTLVNSFADGNSSLTPAELDNLHQKVAQNVGALSFFIETLQSQPEFAKKRFVFDAAAGTFQSKLLEKAPEKELLPSTPLEANPEAMPAATAEQDLIEQQKESERLLASLVDAPEDSDLQAKLKDSLDHERSYAALLDDSDASARAKTAIDLLAHADLSQAAALDEIVAATSHGEAAPEIQLSQELPETEEEIDAELLEIFLTEADEVLGAVRENIPLSRHDTNNQEYLIRLRRSFHTLKGSGRMVGLMVFGEGAWNIEQVMNLWLSETRAGTESLYQLLEYAAEEMFAWVEELKTKGSSGRNSNAIIAAAIRVRDGEKFSVDAAEPVSVVLEPVVLEPVETLELAASEPQTAELDVKFSVQAPALAVAELAVDSPAQAIESGVSLSVDTTAEAELSLTGFDIEPEAESTEILVASDIVEESAPEFSLSIPELEVQEMTELNTESATASTTEPTAELTLDFPEIVSLQEPQELQEEQQPLDLIETVTLDESVDGLDAVAHDLADNVVALTPVIAAPEAAEFADLTEAPTLLTPSDDAIAVQQSAQIIEFPDFSMPVAKESDNTKRIGEIEISLPLHTIYMAETDEIVRFLAQDFSEWRHEPTRPVSRHAVHAAHSLAGSSATVGLFAAQELAHSLENVLQRLERHPVSLENAEFDLLDHSVDCVKAMLQKFALSEMADRVPEENLRLSQLLETVISRSNIGDDGEFITSTNERLDPVLLEPVASELPELDDMLVVEDESLATASISATDLGTDLDEEVVASFVAPLDIEGVDASISLTSAELAAPDHLELADVSSDLSVNVSEDISTELLQTMTIPEAVFSTELAPELEIDLSGGGQDSLPAPVTALVETEAVVDETAIVEIIEPAVLEQAIVEQAAVEQALVAQPIVEQPAPVMQEIPVDRSSSEIELKVSDEIDHDLLPVFLEEGNDLLPMIGQLLRSWQQSPEDDAIPQSILRLMHTVKGSARMAGAMQLGQHTHDMETRIENLMHTGSTIRQPLLEDLLSRHDYAMHLFERLQNPDLAMQAAPVENLAELSATEEMNQFQEALEQPAMHEVEASISASDESLVAQESSVESSELSNAVAAVEVPSLAANVPATDATSTSAKPAIVSRALRQVAPQVVAAANTAPVPLVRVRADILDRLVNQAGEVSISRSKLENEVDTLKASLSELTENVSRLRDQLREVEIQAETQITSRMAFSGDREFDPLEFDRFTRLQELTRMMAESVSDVATVQTALNRTIEGATIDLNAQARLTRELQQDLMRVRMIPFSSVSERLYRIARQTAKEMDKRVNLDIRGTSVEIDRSVLEKMVGPFEHMLRNAIVHGIEARQDRVARGKNEVGELLIEIRQEGNEVVIHFTDDGQGLNINRIREKAKNVGLLTDESFVNESDVVNLIFEPGFSTASEVTELAGRGVGMDVVRSEAASLGGRVSVSTVEGKGAHFTIHLPLTLAVTQVVILNAGGKTFAVPSVLVEQVQQLKSAALATAYNDGAIMWQGNRVPLHYLPSMLGERDATPDTQQYTPILIMKSDNERVAIHVDQIIGNREVVVKNVGPQLARMIGIAGATVLGSGNIVLILNPVPLAQKIEHERAKLPESHVESGAPELGAVAEMVEKQAAPTQVAPVQGLRTHHIVMVVDDSLTVRRVTQRLLVREGYQVVLAKDGIDALEQLQSITPDVMLVDIEMPRMDGFDLTRNVRSDSRTHHIPIIMITSRTADKHRNYAAELGVNEYFGKPYREDDLLTAISGFVNKQIEAV
ncbi:hybrid sensor histidine kinase/response regulator [Undibacterium flavidum]|uniref:histidine kinase n=1 Tax=Undibacterium flavidum TaxID=2762297 RepID=A0ABR6YGM0_9BURK|nr:Hpt domain-containing protein [Undibacterium flavidum]MBC3875681.1 Hpt domain-containing protein [Undibacterium flavidum]